MKQFHYLLYGFIILTLLVSCSSHKNLTEINSENQTLFTIGKKCSVLRSQGTDSYIGNLYCGNVSFDYDFGKYSYSGPVTLEEDFYQSFRSIFYANFFEKIHIDQKVYKLFVDSVKIVSINKYREDAKNLFSCKTCNSTASLKFRGRSYLFPYSNNDELWKQDDYRIVVDTLDGVVRKIYYSNIDSLQSGLYLYKKDELRGGDKLSLTTNNKISFNKLAKLLKTVELSPN